MRRGTTPQHIFNVNADLTSATIFVTYEQSGVVVLEKSNDSLTVSPDTIICSLTQADTLKFIPGTVRVQIRYVLPDGTANASAIMHVKSEEILKDGEISWN